jgi:hypothetical protein
MKKNISFIVCGNGYGHFKRVLLVCNELLKRRDNIKLHIFCSPKHLEFLKNEPNFIIRTSSIELYDSFFEDEPKWLNKEPIKIQKWQKWLSKIKENKIIKESEIVISDNQVGPLILGERIILMGSFLWPYLNLSNENKQFIEVQNIEKKLLEEISPNCLCVKDMAMPMPDLSVTNQIKLPWFCKKHPLRSKNYIRRNKFNILLTGGGTGMLDGLLISVYKELYLQNHFNLFVDNNLFKNLTEIGMSPNLFSFEEGSFNELNLIICRPGVGVLTDVIEYNIPICALPEKDNKEIMYNLMKVEQLGLGIKYDGKIESILNLTRNDKLLNKCISKIEKRDTGGGRVAAEYILNRITENN